MISVTEALKPFSDFDKIPAHVLEAAAERGKEVHRICAGLAMSEYVPFVRPDCRGFVQSFRAWWEEIGPKVIAVEFELINKTRGLVGHPDLLITVDGEAWLIDLKTPATIAKTWGPQIAIYQEMLWGTKYPNASRAFPLLLRKDGSMAKAGPDATPDDLRAFHCALGAYRYFRGQGEMMDEVELKNGSMEFGPLVNVTMMTLRKLAESNPISFYELVELCKNRDHQVFGNCAEDLKALSLIQNKPGGYSVHDSIRNVVLSASKGEGLDLCLVNPIKPGGDNVTDN